MPTPRVGAGASAVGFNFYRASPRYISPTGASVIGAKIRAECDEGGCVRERCGGFSGKDCNQRRAGCGPVVRNVRSARHPHLARAAGPTMISWERRKRPDGGSAAARRTVRRRRRVWAAPAKRSIGRAPKVSRKRSSSPAAWTPLTFASHRSLPTMGCRRLLAAGKIPRNKGPRKNATVHKGSTRQLTTYVHSAPSPSPQSPDATGHFGPYGGRFVPEVLMAPLEELEQAYSRRAPIRRFRPSWRICCQLRGASYAAVLRQAAERDVRRREDLHQARRPAAHRRAQD